MMAADTVTQRLAARSDDAPRADARAAASIWRLALKRVNPIVALHDGDPALPIYCVHPVSGDVAGLRDFADLLGNQRFLGIQVPKERMTAAFGRSIEGMARLYVDLLTALQPDGPIVLAGWSAGAIIALEMAQQLDRAGRQVPLLVALDGAPCNSGGGLNVWNPLYAAKLVWNLPRWIRDDRVHWSWRGLKDRIESKLAFRFGVGKFEAGEHPCDRLAGTDTLDAETMQGLLDAKGWTPQQKAYMHAFYQAMIDYVPAPYAGRVIVYETRTQPLYHLRQIGAAWRKLAPHAEIVSLKGNHSGLVAQPTIGVVAKHLVARLTAVRSKDV